MTDQPKENSGSSAAAAAATVGGDASSPFPLPRITIKFCTQCKWMLRAAYYAQELLSTFSTSLGEVALQPSTGGTFIVEIFHHQPQPLPASSSSSPSPSSPPTTSTAILWDRKTDGGFPETKELKRRVRDVIEPGRNLGHVDRDHVRPTVAGSEAAAATKEDATPTTATTRGGVGEGGQQGAQKECEDCK